MPVFLLIGLIAFFVGAWLIRQRSTLTRYCRWRLDRSKGEGQWHCAYCGAECTLQKGKEPRHCLRHTMMDRPPQPPVPPDKPLPDHHQTVA